MAKIVNELAKEWRERNRNKGLCIQCGRNPIAKGVSTVRCEECFKKSKNIQNNIRLRRIQDGLCPKCGKRKPVLGHINCDYCNRFTVVRDEAYAHYGGARCACCGETEPLFLTIDHINGGGLKHRAEIHKELGRKSMHRLSISASTFLYWLRKNNYPEGFQVLCMNCNSGKFRNHGICPHKCLP